MNEIVIMERLAEDTAVERHTIFYPGGAKHEVSSSVPSDRGRMMHVIDTRDRLVYFMHYDPEGFEE